MPKKRSKGKARILAAQSGEESVGTPSPTDFITVAQRLKVCRLCESKDGPFLNIFEADKVTAKKIEDLMPFGVAENDELPHKICFRCSAKVEELYEFIQKCIKTQISLRTALGKKEPFTTKSKTRFLWEEKLNKSNISNDDICDAIIRRAMEGIKDIPFNPLNLDNSKDAVKSDLSASKPDALIMKKKTSEILLSDNSKVIQSSKDIIDLIESDSNTGDETQLVEEPERITGDKSELRKSSSITPSRTLRSNIDSVSNGGQHPNKSKTASKRKMSDADISSNKKIKVVEAEKGETNLNNTAQKAIQKAKEQDTVLKEKKSEMKDINTHKPDPKVCDQKTLVVNAKQAINQKPFDIMDHVSMIKVNGVGVLFQCKLCNRNFLKMDVVQSHSCAKNRCIPKEDIIRKPNPLEPPKPPSVKYINTKLGSDSKKFATPDASNSTEKTDTITPLVMEGNHMKSKPRIGPASKVKRDSEDPVTSLVGSRINLIEGQPGRKQNIMCGSQNLPPTPNLNCPYKLVPGPNNTFTLVEEPSTQDHDTKTQKQPKKTNESQNVAKAKQIQSGNDSNSITVRHTNTLLLESGQTEATKKQPYPVGLFQTVSKLPSKSPGPQITTSMLISAPSTTSSMFFSATAAQKQSYSIVQTGHPSKLLISSKPQQRAEEPVKRVRKMKMAPHTQQTAESAQPFSVTLDDTSRPLNTDMFSFLNIDPLLTPSYVLPVTSISQSVATSNDRSDSIPNLVAGSNGRYTCNMCNKVFTREQKLLAHIHSHYNKMDEEDHERVSKSNRKRGRKS